MNIWPDNDYSSSAQFTPAEPRFQVSKFELVFIMAVIMLGGVLAGLLF